MKPNPGFAVTLYPARVGAEQRLGTPSARALMDWCASACRKEDYGVEFVLGDPDLLGFMGCSYRTAQRAFAECREKFWLVDVHYDGRSTTARLGAMYGSKPFASAGPAVAVYERALGVRLGAAARAELAQAVGDGEAGLKTLRRACWAARQAGLNFYDVGAVVGKWRVMMVLGAGAAQPPAQVTSAAMGGTAMEWGQEG